LCGERAIAYSIYTCAKERERGADEGKNISPQLPYAAFVDFSLSRCSPLSCSPEVVDGVLVNGAASGPKIAHTYAAFVVGWVQKI